MGDSELDDAEKAICKRAAESAPDASPADLVNLAQAVSHLKHGPRGGSYDQSEQYSSRSDYHYTQHGGEDRQRPRAGFGDD